MSSSVQVARGLTLTSPNPASQLTIGAPARVGPSDRLSDVSQAALSGQGTPQRLHLAELAALVGTAGIGGSLGPRLRHREIEPVALPNIVDEGQCLGKVCLCVQEDDFDSRRNLGDQVDQHNVLERRGQHQGVPEGLDRPPDDGAGGSGFETFTDRGKVLSGQLQRRSRWSRPQIPHLLHGANGPFRGPATGA